MYRSEKPGEQQGLTQPFLLTLIAVRDARNPELTTPPTGRLSVRLPKAIQGTETESCLKLQFIETSDRLFFFFALFLAVLYFVLWKLGFVDSFNFITGTGQRKLAFEKNGIRRLTGL